MLPLISLSKFLLEIGTEELPADFACSAPGQLVEIVRKDLLANRFSHGEIYCTSTPRRVVLLINDLISVASDLEEFRKGPPAEHAFRDGVPTKSAQGFARNLGVSEDCLEVRETAKGPFVYAKVIKQGLHVEKFLAEKIPQWVSNFQGRRFMRWGNGDKRFSRPVRWLIAMFDELVIPICIEDADPKVFSGNISRGHRLYKDQIEIPSADAYVETLANVGVLVDRDERKAFIIEVW